MNAFLLLPPVAEPDLHDVAVHAEAAGHLADLVGARLGTGGKQRLERLPQQLVDVGPLLATTRRHRVERQCRRLSTVTGNSQPVTYYIHLYSPNW